MQLNLSHATELKGNILWINICNNKKKDSFTVYIEVYLLQHSREHIFKTKPGR